MSEQGLMDINESNFQEEVLDSPIPVLVDMWAPWCMPCRMIAPTVEKIAKNNAGKLKVCKLNVDDNQSIAAIIVFRDSCSLNI